MKLLVIGSGGREHAIARKLLDSPAVEQVFVAPGNAGMALDGLTLVNIAADDFEGLLKLAQTEEVTYTFVGPDNALADGIVNYFEAEGQAIFGPSKEAAELEWSKDFAKSIMAKYQIPTASYQTFTDYEAAAAYIKEQGAPIVIKADGLALGKGVVVAETVEEALAAAQDMLLDNKFGDSGARVVIEEFLEGEEFSLFAFVNGQDFYLLPPAQDHKRAFDGDQGPNTGGMGAYSPLPHLPEAAFTEAVETIIKPILAAMEAEGRPYKGVLYAGLILTKTGPKVIEFNARFGDPETQILLPRLKSDFALGIEALLKQEPADFRWQEEGITLGVVVASKGYPGAYQKGSDVPAPTQGAIKTYYAGVEQKETGLVANGGRVYMLVTTAPSVQEAQTRLYQELEQQELDGFFYRTDIGSKALKD
ncbi:phosphoribosylamine--glycine ligase [Streptococcus oricebi]|uniref:Phosphoribosylamine--glycine ligase n=1 Tax=Streptococcus oricebi TaxID=1547447 RepID=A0ABS5B643_9STRE|nr:phosphoribosylamine--glycine ligase [Streptococcus oricebi]MBP2624285.1 phosphoribosylamine--glycine ligase [Streptococcus oricebi]